MSQAQTILRRPAVEASVGLKRTALYDRIRAGTFPAPIKLGSSASGWLKSEVDRWIEERIAESRREAAEQAGP